MVMMMRQMVGKQQKRVYSLQPNRWVFARRYVSYLMPALKNNKENEECSNSDELRKIVEYQVNMAMVLSATTRHHESAWMRALKQKLQTDCRLNGKSFLLPQPRALSLLRNPSCSSASYRMKKYCSSSMPRIRVRPSFRSARTLAVKENDAKKDEEAEMINMKLVSLRRLVPGANEMVDDIELLDEVGSYVTCLQLQVTILRCLVGSMSSYVRS